MKRSDGNSILSISQLFSPFLLFFIVFLNNKFEGMEKREKNFELEREWMIEREGRIDTLLFLFHHFHGTRSRVQFLLSQLGEYGEEKTIEWSICEGGMRCSLRKLTEKRESAMTVLHWGSCGMKTMMKKMEEKRRKKEGERERREKDFEREREWVIEREGGIDTLLFLFHHSYGSVHSNVKSGLLSYGMSLK
jgi:hypothetical protein